MWHQMVIKAQGNIGILGGIRGDPVERYLMHRSLVSASADKVRDWDHLVVQQAEGQIFQFARPGGIQQQAGKHGVEDNAAKPNSVPEKYACVKLQIVSAFGRIRI